jgi:hypothetical protein
MKQVDKDTLRKVLKVIASLPEVKYRIIVPGADGGDPEVITNIEEAARRRRLKDLYAPYLEALEDNSTVAIPIPDDEDPGNFAAAIASWCSGHWGKGASTTHRNTERRVVEVRRHDALRTDAPEQKELIQEPTALDWQAFAHGLPPGPAREFALCAELVECAEEKVVVAVPHEQGILGTERTLQRLSAALSGVLQREVQLEAWARPEPSGTTPAAEEDEEFAPAQDPENPPADFSWAAFAASLPEGPVRNLAEGCSTFWRTKDAIGVVVPANGPQSPSDARIYALRRALKKAAPDIDAVFLFPNQPTSGEAA